MPRITSEQTREVNGLITRFRDLNVANAGSSMVTQVHAQAHYQRMMELMPLGLRASLLAWAGWPSAWGVMYDVAPAHISQRRYISEVEDINELVTGSRSCQNRIPVMMYLLKAYIIGSGQPMSNEFWPDFRRPTWMTRREKEDLVMYVQSLYQTRAVMSDDDMSREEQLQAGAEPTAAEQMAFEMGAEEEESFLDSEEGQAFLNDEDEPDEAPSAVTEETRGGVPFLGNYIVIGDEFMRRVTAAQPTDDDDADEARNLEGVSRYSLYVPVPDRFNPFQNQFGDAMASAAVVRWGESQMSRYNITDLNNRSTLFYKFSPPRITSIIGFPKTIMVIARIACPREAIGQCPLNNVNLPTTIGGDLYLGTLQSSTRYFHAGSEELRYIPSAFIMGVYAINLRAEDMDGNNQPTRNWIARYNNYLNEGFQAQTQAQERTAVAEQGEEGQMEAAEQIGTELGSVMQTFRGRVYGTGAERAKQLANQVKCYVILRSLGASMTDVRGLFSQLYGRTLLPVDVTLSTSAPLREVYENVMKFVELKVMEVQLGRGRSYQGQLSNLMARRFANMTDSELAPLTDRVRLFRFSNTSRNRTSKLVGVQVLPILVNNRDITRSQVLAIISGATTAARQMYLESMSGSSASTSSEQQQAPSTATQSTAMQRADNIAALGRQLENRMIANRVYMFGMQTTLRGRLFSSGEMTITTKVPSFLGPAQDRSYIFYFAMLEENEQGYGRITFYQSEFGPLPYSSTYDASSMTGVVDIETAMRDSGRLDNDEGLYLKKVPLLVKRGLRKFLASDGDELVRFEPTRSSAQREFVSFGRTSALSQNTREAIKEYFQAIMAMAERPDADDQSATTQSSAGGAYGFQFVAKADMERVAQMSFTSTDFAYATFGYEYEGHTKDFSRDELAREMSRQGRPTVSAGYTHRDMSGGEDKIVTDCTVFPTSSDVARGSQIPERNHFEFVTNIENSKGENGLEYLKGTLKLMQKLGARTDVTSGVHIHFGKGRWSEELKNNLCVNYAILEPWFKLGTTQWRREDRMFASAWYKESVWKPSMLSELASCSSDYSRIRLIRATREMRLNATCSRGGPTWEWRFPASCTEADVAEYHIRALYKLILISQYGVLDYNKLGKASHMEAEEYMESFLGRDIHTWWRNRMYDLATQSEIVAANANPSRSGLRLETSKMFNNVLKQ